MEHNIKIYGRNGCPKCWYIETKANSLAGFVVEVVHDDKQTIKIIEENNMKEELPIVVIDGTIMDFSDAKDYLDKNS